MRNNYVNLKKVRSFGEKFNATFEFLRMVFKPLMKAVFIISLPLALPASLLMVLFYKNLINFASLINGVESNGPFIYNSIAVWVLTVGAYFLVTITLLEYINLYNEKQSKDISVEEVWGRVRKILLPAGFMVFIISISYLLVIFIGSFFTALVGVSGLLFLAVILFAILLIYFSIVITLALPVFVLENRKSYEFVDVLKRCFFLIKGKWWSTFGIIFITSIIVSVVVNVISIPISMMSIGETFSNEGQISSSLIDLMSIFSGFTTFASILLSVIPMIAISFQYFNLTELKEAKGLMEKIASIKEDESAFSQFKTGDKEDDERY